MLREGLGRFRHLVGVVWLTRLDADERLELIITVEEVALELDARDDETLALRHVDGDGNVLLVRRNSHLRGINAELQVTALQVIRTQGFQVSIELGARIAVALGVPAEPATSVQIEQALERGFAEGLVAGDVDFLDARRLALRHREGQVNAIALHRGNSSHYLGAVQALVDVLALELLLCTVGQRLVERAPLGQAHIAHRLLQCVLVELLGAGELHVGNRGPLFDHHHKHVAIGL